MNKTSIIIAIIFIIAGSLLYFAKGIAGIPSMSKRSFDDFEFKTAYSDGELKIFAHAPNNMMASEKADGNPLPEIGTIVIGSREAKKTGVVPGTVIKVFGREMRIDGVLRETGTIMDYMYLFSSHDFEELLAESGRIKSVDEHIIYYFDKDDPIIFNLREGNLEEFRILNKDSERYYPALFGAGINDNKLKLEDTMYYDDEYIVVKGFIENTDSAVDKVILIGEKI